MEVIVRLIGFFSAIAAGTREHSSVAAVVVATTNGIRTRAIRRRSVPCAAIRATGKITAGRCAKSCFNSDSGRVFNTSSFESRACRAWPRPYFRLSNCSTLCASE